MFDTFGSQHLLTLAIIAALQIGVLVYTGKFASEKGKNIIRWIVVMGLLGHEAIRHIYFAFDGRWDYHTILPLHLCGLNVFLVAYVLLTKSHRAYPVAYFWTIGAIHSILTPSITDSFPSYYYIEYFFGHSLTILGILFLIITSDLRPTFRSLNIAIIVSFAVIGLIGAVNLILDANYMYLRYPPEGDNLAQLFPDGNYLVILILVGIIHFYLFYLPYCIRDFVQRKKLFNPKFDKLTKTL